MASYTKKRISVICTGGTIAGNVATNDITNNEKHDAHSFSATLNNSIAIIKNNWNIEITASVVDLFNLDSANIQPLHWTTIIEYIQNNYDEFDAFVILHGTNTMGYTASALSFALENINKPVILTGAQVPLGYLGTDAVTNLVNSLRLAIWWYHEIKGVMAVFGSKIIAGTRVKKWTDFDYDPFSSFQTGSLGQIGRFIRINEPALRKYTSYLSKKKPLAIQSRVLSVSKEFDTKSLVSLTEFPGMSASLFQSLVENNAIKGVILRSFGAGDPNADLYPAFEYLKEKCIPIVVTTQAPNGVASFQVNETGQYLRLHDLAIPAYDMSIESITVKLAWLLWQGRSYEQIKKEMVEDFHGEITIESELI